MEREMTRMTEHARVAELADAVDLKSTDASYPRQSAHAPHCSSPRFSSSPAEAAGPSTCADRAEVRQKWHSVGTSLSPSPLASPLRGGDR